MSNFDSHETRPSLGAAGVPQIQVYEIRPAQGGGNVGSRINILAFKELVAAGFTPEQARDFAIFTERIAVTGLIEVFCSGADNYRLGIVPCDSEETELVGGTYFDVSKKPFNEIVTEQDNATTS